MTELQSARTQTDLQVVIHNLKAAHIAGELLLVKLREAQKDLEKSPPHKWEHGDVFQFSPESIMIYIHENPEVQGTKPQVFRISNNTATTGPPDIYLRFAKFLFNIKEKL